MKKIIFVVALLIATLSLNSQVYNKQTDKLDIDYGKGYLEWIYYFSEVKVDLTNNQIIFYGLVKQEFNILKHKSFITKDGKLIKCYCIDYNGYACNIDVYLNSNKNWHIVLYNNNIKYDYRFRIMGINNNRHSMFK